MGKIIKAVELLNKININDIDKDVIEWIKQRLKMLDKKHLHLPYL